MALNPNITAFKPVEGETKQFGPNDIRKLARTPAGVVRWLSVNKQDKEQTPTKDTAQQNPNSDPLKLKTVSHSEIKLPNNKQRIIDKYIKDNPFLSCVKLEDIDALWYEEMLKIKSDKKWYENEINSLTIKMELAAENSTKKVLAHNIDRFREVTDSNEREDILNMQRITYEYYRLYNTIDTIKQSNPAFDYNSFMTEGKTLDELEQLLESEPENV